MKKKLIIIIIIVTNLICTSCWNYKEVEAEHIISGVSIDYDDINDEVIVNLEVVKPVISKGSYLNESEIIENRGKSFFDAVRNNIQTSGKKAFWSHCKVFIFSENLIKNTKIFTSTLDFIRRDAEVRDNSYVLMSKDKMAKDVWKTDVKIAKITSFYLSDMLENEKDISEYHAMEIWRFVDALETDYISATLPTLSQDFYMNKIISEIKGTAVFKQESVVGWLSGNETKNYLLLIDKLKGGVYTIEIAYDKDKFPVAFEIINSDTKIQPKIENGKIYIDISSKINVNINEYSSQIDLFNKEGLIIMQEQCEQKISRDVKALLQKVQHDYKCDIFGFGKYVKIKFPSLFKSLDDTWDNVFSSLEINFTLDYKIKGSALKSKPVKVVE